MQIPSNEAIAMFLRGINVGGRNTVPMADLRAILTDRGYRHVATYIQSGNVACFPPANAPADIAADVADAMAAATGLTVPVIVRTASELRATRRNCPFDPLECDPKFLHVMFLSSEPDADAAAQLDPQRSPADEFRFVGPELWVYYRDGQGRSKLTIDYIERVLGVTATGRNWNTVVKMDEMLETIG
jgi:uncharacterized protein (DUF1697 family)